MNIIFLDIDGVITDRSNGCILNARERDFEEAEYSVEENPEMYLIYDDSPKTTEDECSHFGAFRKDYLDNLKKIIRETNSKVSLITSRKFQDMYSESKWYVALKNYLGDVFTDSIPRNHEDRRLFIYNYLTEHPDTNFIILDDMRYLCGEPWDTKYVDSCIKDGDFDDKYVKYHKLFLGHKAPIHAYEPNGNQLGGYGITDAIVEWSIGNMNKRNFSERLRKAFRE